MTRLSLTLAAALLFVGSSGCVAVSRGYRDGPAVRSARCHPSQHWDGQQCRHNGKGHGARKHDGRGHPGKKR